MKKVCVLIPAFNESQSIGKLVAKLKAMKLDILVIDDGSCDSTQEIARNNGSIVLRNERNLGKGASLLKGFEYVLNNHYDAVITMDADGQHLPEDIPVFMKQAMDKDTQLLIGNRMQDRRAMPKVRIATNLFMSWIISKYCCQKIPDTQCGFRLIKKEVLQKLHLTTSKYETESEILLESARMGIRITSLPIHTVYIGEKSHINPFTDTLRFIKLISRRLWSTKT